MMRIAGGCYGLCWIKQNSARCKFAYRKLEVNGFSSKQECSNEANTAAGLPTGKAGLTARGVYGFKQRLCSLQEFGGLSGQIMKSYRTAKLSLTADEARYASEMQ